MNKHKIKAIAFDVDGTIFSADEILFDCYYEAFRNFKEQIKMELQELNRDFLISQIGKPSSETIKKMFPTLNQEQRNLFSQFSLQALCENIQNGGGFFYKNIKEVIIKLKQENYLLFVCSNGRKKYLQTILNRENLSHFFEEIITLDDINKNKKEDLLKFYLDKYKLLPQEMIMIGDRDMDQIAAYKNKVPFLFCNYGHAKKNEILQFDDKVENCEEIISAIQKISILSFDR